MQTITRTTTDIFKIETCYKCGVRWGMLDRFVSERREDSNSFYCPNGHSQAYVESQVDKLRGKLNREIASHDRTRTREREQRDRKEHVQRRLSATQGVVTRVKNRVGNGVCPCCNRSFPNLKKHMECKHPKYKRESADD
jgi:hypothetical protein